MWKTGANSTRTSRTIGEEKNDGKNFIAPASDIGDAKPAKPQEVRVTAQPRPPVAKPYRT